MELREQLVKQISCVLAACIPIVCDDFLRAQLDVCLDTLLAILYNLDVSFDLFGDFSCLNCDLLVEEVFQVFLVHR